MYTKQKDFIKRLYPLKRNWTNEQIVDVLIYFSISKKSCKYYNDTVLVFDQQNQLIKTFYTYENFLNEINIK